MMGVSHWPVPTGGLPANTPLPPGLPLPRPLLCSWGPDLLDLPPPRSPPRLGPRPLPPGVPCNPWNVRTEGSVAGFRSLNLMVAHTEIRSKSQENS